MQWFKSKNRYTNWLIGFSAAHPADLFGMAAVCYSKSLEKTACNLNIPDPNKRRICQFAWDIGLDILLCMKTALLPHSMGENGPFHVAGKFSHLLVIKPAIIK